MFPASSVFQWVIQRETSFASPFPSFSTNLLYESMQTKRESTFSSDYLEYPAQSAIFNIDFSRDGSLMAAVSKDRRILVFDSNNQSLVNVRTNAHNDCINSVRFYGGSDRNRLMTCSDDKTIKLWDIRKACSCSEELQGHTYLIKNVDYFNGYVISSGFDGKVYAWNINSFQENIEPILLLDVANIVRTVVSSDHRKIVITTLAGYMIVIHDADIPTLPTDLAGFNPTQPYISDPSVFSLSRRRNRVDIIQDFLPSNDDVSHVFSAQLDPSGNCILARYYATDFQTADHEFTTVHYLHQERTEEEEQVRRCGDTSAFPTATFPASYSLFTSPQSLSSQSSQSSSPSLSPPISPNESSATLSTCRSGPLPVGLNPSSSSSVSTAASSNGGEEDTVENRNRKYNQLMMRNRRSLHYYIEEPNMRRGIIKEVSFSGDGRVIASPYAHGVRLLAYDAQCSAFVYQAQPTPLTEIKTLYSHNNLTLTTKISPDNSLIVTGCNNGLICFHTPVF